MKNSDFILFFFIIFDLMIKIIFIVILSFLIRKNNQIENYIDELNLEVAKIRRK